MILNLKLWLLNWGLTRSIVQCDYHYERARYWKMQILRIRRLIREVQES